MDGVAIISSSSLEWMRLVPPPTAQKIQRRVVRDAKQPALGIGDPSGRSEAPSIALISASWTTSSPSMTEPVMRAQ